MKDINKIMDSIPHRYPFLLVDRVLEESEGYIKTLKNVTANEPQFTGHFPFYPIMPGVLIIEAMAQSAALMFAGNSGTKVVFMSIDKARFRKEVRPGDQLIMEISIIQNRGGKVVKFKGIASVDGQKVAEAEMMAGLNA